MSNILSKEYEHAAAGTGGEELELRAMVRAGDQLFCEGSFIQAVAGHHLQIDDPSKLLAGQEFEVASRVRREETIVVEAFKSEWEEAQR